MSINRLLRVVWNVLILLIVAVVGTSAYIFALVHDAKRVEPIARVCTLAELKERFPNEIQREVSYLSKQGNVTCVYLKSTKNSLMLPSGPPALIFDRDGILVDFCYDVGDSPSFVEKWDLWKTLYCVISDDFKSSSSSPTN